MQCFAANMMMGTKGDTMNTRSLIVQQFCRGLLLAAAAVFSVPLGAWADLPAGYTQIDYIQSTGTQWIGTGYLPKTNSCLQADWQFIGSINRSGGGGSPIGCSEDSAAISFSMNFSSTSGQDNRLYTWFDKGSGKGGSSIYFEITTAIRTSRNTFTLDAKNGLANYGGVSKDVQKKTTTHSVNTFVLFGSNTGTVTPLKYYGLRLFGFKIYEGDTLVRDFVPCIKKVGDATVAGLYDAAHPEAGDASFYANQGTGDFIFIRNAMDFFVTPAGAGMMNGNSWSNAFAGLTGISGAIRTGDRIHCAVGTYPVSNQISIVDFASLELRGGYAGTNDATPYAKAATGETRLTPAEGVGTRLVYAKNSTIRMHDLVIAEGTYTGVAHASGLGAYFDTCAAVVSNCVFDSNSVIGQPCYTHMDAPKGGAIYASGGELEVVDCLVTNCVLTKTEDNCRTFGGGLYAITTEVTVRRTAFFGNLIGNSAQNSFGGAIYLESANAVIDDCLFTSNRTYSGRSSSGSAVYATGLSKLEISNSRFLGNAARGNSAFGGTLALVGGATTMATRLDRCIFRGNGYDPSSASFNSGSIGMNGGRLEMRHCLVAELNVRVPADSRNRSGDYKRSIDIVLGTLLLDACTVAGNNGYGIYRDITYGNVDIRNSIVYSNPLGNVNIGSATYSCMEGAVAGEGVFADAPLLSTDGYYHPNSAAGRLTDGYFSGVAWTTDAVTSPTIDKGTADGDWYDEPQPNNLRVNIGYDANTAAASKSATGDYVFFDSITVIALPPTNVVVSSACPMGIVGEVGGDGTVPATVTLVWDIADKGTNAVPDWTHSVPLGSFAKWDIFSTRIDGIVGGSLCYRFFAENTTGASWSDPFVYAMPVKPSATGAVVSHVRRHSASVSTTLTDDGNDVCKATVIYWLADAPGTTWTASAEAIPEGESTRIPLTGLSSSSEYDFRIEVENRAGKVTSEGAFTTAADDVPQVFYLTPEGAGIQDGTSWANAYAELLPIVDECQGTGDVVYMKHGAYDDFSLVFNEKTQVVIANAAGLTIRGGYAGEGAPGALSDQPTEIKRDTQNAFRLLRFRNSVLRLENLIFHGGSVATDENDGGAAISLLTCNTVLADCLFTNNTCTSKGSYVWAMGGAVFANSGSLVVTNCTFSNNRVAGSPDNSLQFGGALATWNAALEIQRSLFEGNYSQMSFKVVSGGAVYTYGGTVAITDSLFTNNYSQVRTAGGGATDEAYGGALSIQDAISVRLADSVFAGNRAIGFSANGGTVYLDDHTATTMMTTVVTRCVFDGYVPGLSSVCNSFQQDGGLLFMTNCLVSRGTGTGGGFANLVIPDNMWCNGSKAATPGAGDLVNVTVAGNAGWGARKFAATGTMNLRNCIAWGNVEGGVSNATTVVFTDTQDGVLGGAGNISGDPRFVDAANGNFRLKSRSPCGNVGNRAGFTRGDVDLDREPRIRGGIDFGCYESCGAGGSYLLVR